MPKTKKQESSSSDSDSGPDDKTPPSKKAKPVATSSAKDAAGEKVWTLEKLRQVRINDFRGRLSVDIREFYEKDGKILPGKKGIALSATQWKKLLEIADEVNKALKES